MNVKWEKGRELASNKRSYKTSNLGGADANVAGGRGGGTTMRGDEWYRHGF